MKIGLPLVAMQKGASLYLNNNLKAYNAYFPLYQILFNIVVAFGNAVKG